MSRPPLLARKHERTLWSVYLHLSKVGKLDNKLTEKFRAVGVGQTTVIEHMRTKRGYTCSGLARRLGLSNSLMYKIEKRTRPVPSKTAIKLMEFFAVDLEDLVDSNGRALTLADSDKFCLDQLTLDNN